MADLPVYDLESGKPHPFHVPHASIWPLAGAARCRLAVRQGDEVSRVEKYRFRARERQHFSCQIEAKTPLGGIHYVVV